MRYLKEAKVNDIIIVPAYVLNPGEQGPLRFKWLPAIVRLVFETITGVPSVTAEYVVKNRIISRDFIMQNCQKAKFDVSPQLGAYNNDVLEFEKTFNIPRQEILKLTVKKRKKHAAQLSFNFIQ